MKTNGMASEAIVSTGTSRARREKFRRALLTWAKSNLRDLPWRRAGTNAYGILVAELLLKRTTATAAARLYGPFMDKYPSISDLANASEYGLTETLVPVGLSRQRARAIRQLAFALTRQHGNIPNSIDMLCALPGIGDYAARAILSFGFDIPVAVVDGNVERVIGRAFHDQPELVKSKRAVQRAVDGLLPRRRHQDFNFALLDLGSLVCRPAKPLCANCPLRRQCDYALSPQSIRPSSRLRKTRQAKGLSLLELANRAGVSKLTVINIEARRTSPREETLLKIAMAMDVAVEEIK